jgi:hypothetical protein
MNNVHKSSAPTVMGQDGEKRPAGVPVAGIPGRGELLKTLQPWSLSA